MTAGSGISPGEGNGHSSILAWKIPWTKEPGWLQSMGSQRVRYDCVTTVDSTWLILTVSSSLEGKMLKKKKKTWAL